MLIKMIALLIMFVSGFFAGFSAHYKNDKKPETPPPPKKINLTIIEIHCPEEKDLQAVLNEENDRYFIVHIINVDRLENGIKLTALVGLK